MNIVLVNPCRPFKGMRRKGDFLVMLKDSMTRAFRLNDLASACVNEAIHQAFSERETVIMYDILKKIGEFRISGYYPEIFCFELEKKLQCMVDTHFPEHTIFCERDGIAVNEMDVNGLRALLAQASSNEVREMLSILINFSLLF